MIEFTPARWGLCNGDNDCCDEPVVVGIVEDGAHWHVRACGNERHVAEAIALHERRRSDDSHPPFVLDGTQ